MNTQYNYVIKCIYAFDKDDCYFFTWALDSNKDQLRTIPGNIKKNPIIMCISYTWLCNDILDIELAIPGYQNIYTAKIELLK